MNLMIIKILFCLTGFLFTILFSVRAFGKFKDAGKLSAFVSLIAIFLLLYILFAIVFAFVLPNYLHKIIMFIFGISPFIIGKLVSYKNLKIYSIIQILCVILSLVFVVII